MEILKVEDVSIEDKVIAVDFDGPVHNYDKDWYDGTVYDSPTDGVFKAFQKLSNKGYKVVIFTARNDLEPVKIWINDRLKELELDHLKIEVTNKKPKAIMYIDDRGIRFTNWKDILKYF